MNKSQRAEGLTVVKSLLVSMVEEYLYKDTPPALLHYQQHNYLIGHKI